MKDICRPMQIHIENEELWRKYYVATLSGNHATSLNIRFPVIDCGVQIDAKPLF